MSDGSEPTLMWPEQPTCHEIDPRFRYADLTLEWKERGGTRHCSYCGSLHPEDLLRLMREGAELGGSDRKYGFPHKFYVYGAVGPGGMGKFYTNHLSDQGYSDAAWNAVVEMLARETQITFVREDGTGRVMYRAPYFGYQAMTKTERASWQELREEMGAAPEAGSPPPRKEG